MTSKDIDRTPSPGQIELISADGQVVPHLVNTPDAVDPYADFKANHRLSEQPGRGSQSLGNHPWNQPVSRAEIAAHRDSLSPAELAAEDATRARGIALGRQALVNNGSQAPHKGN